MRSKVRDHPPDNPSFTEGGGECLKIGGIFCEWEGVNRELNVEKAPLTAGKGIRGSFHGRKSMGNRPSLTNRRGTSKG